MVEYLKFGDVVVGRVEAAQRPYQVSRGSGAVDTGEEGVDPIPSILFCGEVTS